MSEPVPLKIEWDFAAWAFPRPEMQIDQGARERIEAMYFVDAGNEWSYVLRGWPEDQPHPESLAIRVEFVPFDPVDDDAIARVPVSSLQRTGRFPHAATMQVNANQLPKLLGDRARFFDTIVHEIGHALGIGMPFVDITDGQARRLLKLVDVGVDAEGNDVYQGQHAVEAFAADQKDPAPAGVPIDLAQRGKERSFHWSEEALGFDIMSTWLDQQRLPNAVNVMSGVTVGALEDIGYLVNDQGIEKLPSQIAGTGYPAIK